MNEPLYAQLARDLRTAIANGRHPAGAILPGEHDLAEAHEVSRATVRAALSLLEQEGLVERRRGAGTKVLSPRAPKGFGQAVGSVDELIQYARSTRRVVRSTHRVVADRALAASIGVAAGSKWLLVRSVRIDPARPGTPICTSDAYLPAELGAITRHLDDQATAMCELLARHLGVRLATIEQELQGAVLPKELAGVLDARAGDPALRILRRYLDATGAAFLINVAFHPADRFAYRMKLERAI